MTKDDGLAWVREAMNRQITELAVMRILVTCLVRQVTDAGILKADFDQSVDEQRALGELASGGSPDPVFEKFATLYSGWISVAGKGPLARD